MTHDLISVVVAIALAFLFAVWIVAALYPRARTPDMPPKEIAKVRYDFRDDAPELWRMIQKKYKSKDSLRKIKKVFAYIYDHYENKCKKCTR